MSGWLIFIVIVLLIGLYFVLLRRPGSVGNTLRKHAALDNWSAFNAGYRAALHDTDTLRPVTEKATRASVERAFRRTYIERS